MNIFFELPNCLSILALQNFHWHSTYLILKHGKSLKTVFTEISKKPLFHNLKCCVSWFVTICNVVRFNIFVKCKHGFSANCYWINPLPAFIKAGQRSFKNGKFSKNVASVISNYLQICLQFHQVLSNERKVFGVGLVKVSEEELVIFPYSSTVQ